MTDFTFKRADGSQQIVDGYIYEEPQAGTKTYNETRYKKSDLPRKVDLRKHMTRVENQGQTSSCTANAVAGAYEYLAKKHTGQDYDVSRMFIYYNARLIGAGGDESKIKAGGSGIGKAIESLQKFGACSETIYPFTKEAVSKAPDEEAYLEAADFLIEDTALVPTDLYAWKHSLAEGYPIIFGLNLFDSFDKQRQKGLVPQPSDSETSREKHGCHAMLAVGYSEVDKVFIVRNSWGEDWGDAGYCYIPYDYLINKKFNIGDSWIIKQLNNTDFDTQDHWEDDEKSIISKNKSALGKMKDKAYQKMLDSMGDHSLEYRLALFFLYAANADADLSDEKYSSIAVYMTETIENFGITMNAESILRYAIQDITNVSLISESVGLLRESFSSEVLTQVMSNIESVASLDESSSYDTSSISELLKSWEASDDEEADDEDADDEEADDEEADDEEADDEEADDEEADDEEADDEEADDEEADDEEADDEEADDEEADEEEADEEEADEEEADEEEADEEEADEEEADEEEADEEEAEEEEADEEEADEEEQG